MDNQLYNVKGTKRYGTVLTTDSKGRYVLEMKGEGEVEAFKKDKLEEVIPYTVGITYEGKGSVYQFLSKEGDVAEGDYLVIENIKGGNYCIVRVAELGTKSRTAKRTLTGFNITQGKNF